MANTVTNKAGLSEMPVKRFTISGSEIIKHLRDQLGFDIPGYDFTRWTGPYPEVSYVRMRVVFHPEDIIAKVDNQGYVDRVLEANAADINFKDTVKNTLEPFMYPESTKDLFNNPEALEQLYNVGLYGERLTEVIRNMTLNYCAKENLYRVYLRPERIIKDMLADPSTNKIDGEMSIVAVYGTTSDTIRWEVVVTKGRQGLDSGVSMNAIFNS